MADGGHFVSSGNASRIRHFEVGVGYGMFPIVPTHVSFASLEYFDPHNENLDRIWAGGRIDTAGGPAPVWEWNGTIWTRHTVESVKGDTWISRVPGTNEIYCGIDEIGSPWNYWRKYDGVSSWVQLRSPTTAYNMRFVPWAISSSQCVWISSGSYASMPGYWTHFNNQYSGGDLPVEGFAGICMNSLGELFLLSNSGNVYRGSPAGGFVLDNPSTPFGSGFSHGNSMNIAADGVTVVVQKDATNYWVRSGYDSWSDKGPTGNVGTQGQPSAVNSQLLCAGASDNIRFSLNGGASWYTPPHEGGDAEKGTCALFTEKSTSKRMLGLYRPKSNPATLWWRGDAPYSPWACWKETRADPDTLSAISNNRLSIQGFPTGEVVIGTAKHDSWLGALHYDPDADSWSAKNTVVDMTRVYGNAYLAGRIHGIGQGVSNIYYMRWNGTGYDTAIIPGSTSSGGLNLHASDDGQHIWVVGGAGQLWHSSDGGSSWINRHAAALAVHGDATQAKDVVVVSATEVYVAFETASSPAVRFSKWNGSAWSVGAPNLTEDAGNKCLLKDTADKVWFFGSVDFVGDSNIRRLDGGSWTTIHTFTGSRVTTGVAALPNNTLMATSNITPNILASNCPADGFGWLDAVAYGNNIPTAQEWQDVAPWDIATPPYLDNEDPAPGATWVDVDTTVDFHILDDEDDIDPSTIVITINDVVAYENQAGQNGFIVTRGDVTNGYSFVIRPPQPFLYNSTVVVEVYAEDDESAVLDTNYSFDIELDQTLPRIVLVHPKNEGEVNKFGPLVFDLLDDESGIDLKTLTATARITFEPTTQVVRTNMRVDEGWRVVLEELTPGSYRAYFYPDRFTTWRDGETVTISLTVYDLVGNAAAPASFEFTASGRPMTFETFDFMVGAIRELDEPLPPKQEPEPPEPEPPPSEEVLDMPAPQVDWVGTTPATVKVYVPHGAMDESVSYKLKGGNTYPLEATEGAPQTCTLASTGVGGLDTGTRAVNKWYHLYLVPDGGILKPIFSLNDPDTGPSGFAEYLPILVVFNNSSDEIEEFEVTGPWVHIRRQRQLPRIFALAAAGATVNTWFEIDLADATITTPTATADGWVTEGGAVVPAGFPGFPMEVISAVHVMGFLDEDSGGSVFYLRGGLAKPTEVPSADGSWGSGGNGFLESNGATTSNMPVALPTSKLYWYCIGGGTLDVAMRVSKFRHKYRW